MLLRRVQGLVILLFMCWVCWGLDLVCGDAVRLGCFIWFGLIVGRGFVVVLIWVG